MIKSPENFFLGKEMYGLCEELFPICRSITGEGFRQSLEIVKKHIPELSLKEVPTGTKCFDWQVPKEWNISDAYIIAPNGRKLCDYKKNDLHVVGYSVPVNKTLPLSKLEEHLYSLPDQANAIPYITSYYNESWGFCITQEERDKLEPGNYKVVIESELKAGVLNYGELIIKGDTNKEVFISSYLCHPSMANNELSGPVVTTFLAKWLGALNNKKFTYRIIFIPETIGSITYLSRNLEQMRKNIIAGFNLTCIGDERAYSYLPSRQGDTLADQVVKHVLKHQHPDFITYNYLDRGSDERQYCSPGIDLPVCTVMRSKFGCYPEYHTSLDDLTLVTPDGLLGGYEVVQKSIECIENNNVLKRKVLCEPQLGKRGLYPTLSTKDSSTLVQSMMDFIAYVDGSLTNLEICERIGVPLWEINKTIKTLEKKEVLEQVEDI